MDIEGSKAKMKLTTLNLKLASLRIQTIGQRRSAFAGYLAGSPSKNVKTLITPSFQLEITEITT